MAVKSRKPKVLRQDPDGSKIVQQPGSLGYQVYWEGQFLGFHMEYKNAEGLLNAFQSSK